MSSLAAGAHFCWVVEEEEEERRARGSRKRVTWNSSVQVRSISPRRLKMGGEGAPAGSRPPVGLLSTHGGKKLEEENKDNKDKARTLVSLRMLSQSTKALVGQMS